MVHYHGSSRCSIGTFVNLSNILGPWQCATLDRGVRWSLLQDDCMYIHCKSKTEYSVARAIEPTQRTRVPLVSSWLWLQFADVRSELPVDDAQDLE